MGGVPAQIIKYRFSEADIEKLLALKLYDLDEKQFLKMVSSYRQIILTLCFILNKTRLDIIFPTRDKIIKD